MRNDSWDLLWSFSFSFFCFLSLFVSSDFPLDLPELQHLHLTRTIMTGLHHIPRTCHGA